MKVIKNWQRYVLEWGILAALKRLRRLRTPWDPPPPITEKGSLATSFSAVRGGFEPPVRLPVRQFSKLVVSATHPSHQADPFSLTGLQRYK